MRLFEILDSPYNLDDNTPYALAVLKNIRDAQFPITGLHVYENTEAELPSNKHEMYYLLRTVDGVWEAHHNIYVDGAPISGVFYGQSTRPNPRMISTLYKLLKSKINAGKSVRIVSSPVMFRIYQKLAERLVNRSNGKLKLHPEDTNYTGVDGKSYYAQVVSPVSHSIFDSIKVEI